MAIIKGQIESLKKIKAELAKNGLSRFKSVKDLNVFLENYEFEKDEFLIETELEFDEDIEKIRADRDKFQQDYNTSRASESSVLNRSIESLTSRINELTLRNSNILLSMLNWLRIANLKIKKRKIEENFIIILNEQTKGIARRVNELNNTISDYTNNREKYISRRSKSFIDKLEKTKEIVESLYPYIAGAIGENLVVKEIKKLSDRNILLNDFNLRFDPPIYNKKENKRIQRVQIDHLLINNSGIFLIETKNWSKQSIVKVNLRSPVEQIRRSSYAMFVTLNSSSKKNKFKLTSHHWGEKQIPIRNVIVMINHKPKEKFKFVDVKTLNELNNYVSFFDKVFDNSDVALISKHLNKMNHHSINSQ